MIGPHDNIIIRRRDCLDWAADYKRRIEAGKARPISCWLTDPPYGLGDPPPMDELLRAWLDNKDYNTGVGFMGACWDVVPGPHIWRAFLEISYPGAWLFAFGGTRTVDLLSMSLRIAGWVKRDEITHWIYGSGFPKSCSISKQLDRQESNRWHKISNAVDNLDVRAIIELWKGHLSSAKSAMPQLEKSLIEAGTNMQKSDFAPLIVAASVNQEKSNISAIIAELNHIAHQHSLEENIITFAQGNVAAITEQLKGHAILAARLSKGQKASLLTEKQENYIKDSIARHDVAASHNDAVTEVSMGAEALRMWLGDGGFSKGTSIDVLCAALIESLKRIILNHSKTFQNLDTMSQMDFVSATTVIITESTAALLISSMASILKKQAVDGMARAEREDLGPHPNPNATGWITAGKAKDGRARITAPATHYAKLFDGYGTALKPAQEIILAFQKPLTEIAEQDIISRSLLILGVKLCQLSSVKDARQVFGLSHIEQKEALDFVQWSAEEKYSTRAALLEAMDTSLYESVISTSLNIVLSWKSIWEETSKLMSMFTTKMMSSMITDLRILRSFLLEITPESIAKGLTKAGGQRYSVEHVENRFNALLLKCRDILTLFAQESVTGKKHTLRQGEAEKGIRSHSIVIFQAPRQGHTFAELARLYGTGGLCVEAGRVGTSDTYSYPGGAGGSSFGIGKGIDGTRTDTPEMHPLGRFPPNAAFSHNAPHTVREDDSRHSCGYPTSP